MDDHNHEENEVEPRERALETSNQTPGHGEEHVRDIVWLSYDCKPAINHDMIARVRLNCLGVLDNLPRHLSKGIPVGELALFLVTECVLLTVGTIPHPVEGKDTE